MIGRLDGWMKWMINTQIIIEKSYTNNPIRVRPVSFGLLIHPITPDVRWDVLHVMLRSVTKQLLSNTFIS